MLPKELLVVRKRKGSIIPMYLSDTHIAQELIDLFVQNKGQKYKKIMEKREELEEYNFKVVRGLSNLLERRCLFSGDSTLLGKEVRYFLFENGFVNTIGEREERLKEASCHFHISKSEVEEAMFSDMWDEQVLTEFSDVGSDELIRWYNLSLTQTLLFDALGLHFKVVGNYQHIFRHIKYLGLMYEIDDGVRVTGPGSLFKKNRRYGTSLAKLLPEILKAQQWEIHAIIETNFGGEPRVFTFDLDSKSLVSFPKVSEPVSHFDSAVEQQFYRDFNALNLGWEIVREPDVVKAGTYVIIPDFGFYKQGMKHFLEIIGFWTPEYLEKKIAKLKDAEVAITVAVNENLYCKKQDFLGDVIFYNNRIPLMEIVRILREIEQKQIDEEIRGLGEIHLSEDVVSIQDVAKEYHVSHKTIMELEIPNYQLIGDQIVSKVLLEKVKEEIRPNDDYKKVDEILRNYHMSSLALDVMGFRVIWDGLQPTKVMEKKIS
jgi:predicted nuclease of restriction endonuclease-like RecB superfamily